MSSPATLSDESLAFRRELAALAARYHASGWMLGTSGNLSARCSPDSVVITASSCDKGLLTESDFVEVDLDGEVIAAGPGKRPSAETSIHLSIYQRCPDVRAALHVHTPDSSLLNQGASNPSLLDFTGYEMVKGWGLWEPGAVAKLPLFDNHADVPRIAEDVAQWLTTPQAVPALIIERHGITAWGASLEEAHRHLEVTEFFCRVARSAGDVGAL